MSERTRITALLKRHGILLRKSMGQHFLADITVLSRIAEACGAGPDADVVEVGAGIGNLTTALANAGARVTAIEIDTRFAGIHGTLAASLRAHAGPVDFHYGDALEFDFAGAAARAAAAGRRFLVAGNIPYQITSPLVMRVLETVEHLDAMTLLMQKEVAERLAARPGSRRNGAITIKAAFYCSARSLFDVGRTAFLPPPEVTSQLVRFERRDAPLDETGRGPFFRLVEAAFMQRRKMLPNAVSAAGVASREAVSRSLVACGLLATARAEELGLEDFLALYRALETQ